jgi:hypothetical protein
MPTFAFTQTASTYTLGRVTHPQGGTIDGSYYLSGSSWYWSVSAVEAGKMSMSASGTVAPQAGQSMEDARVIAEQRATALGQAAYDAMTAV